MNLYIYCPLCPHWWSWGGHLDPIIKDIKRHVRKEHAELGSYYTRTDGGIVDEKFGALLAEPKREA